MTRPQFDLQLTQSPTPDADRQAKLDNPGFGSLFTDHMVQIRYEEGKGWVDARLCPRQPLQLDPCTSVIHYGQAIFEGLKAFKREDGHIATFRPADHGARFQRSAARMAMPALPVELFLESLDVLIRTDQAWVPAKSGQTLYLRPTMIATDPYLGVRPSKTYLYFLIASPAANYFAKGLAPVDVWVTRQYVRAAPGGTGAAKVAGNYAASLLGQQEAMEHGCEQVVWLDAKERRYIEELGGMNLFFGLKEDGKTKLVTPELGDTVLAGITRASTIQLARDAGIEVEERPFSLSECIEGIESGKLTEGFACGTAAVITPLGKLRSAEGEWTIHAEGAGPIATQLRERLLGIQYGSQDDPHGWSHVHV